MFASSSVRRFAAAAAAALLLAYAIELAYAAPLMLQDNPNHLARGVVMADLIFGRGREYGGDFRFQFLFMPYLLGDLLMAALVRILGTSAAIAVWTAGVFLSLPLALLSYVRAKKLSFEAGLLIVLLGAYCGTDAFFLMGFIAFRMAVAWVFFALAAAEVLRRRWSIAWYAAYLGIVVGAYLTHFAATVFMVIVVATTALIRWLQRSTTIRREVLLLAPLGAAFAWQYLVANHYRQSEDAFTQTLEWPALTTKLLRFAWDFLRYTPRTDLLLVALLATALFLWGWRGAAARNAAPVAFAAALEPWALVAVLVAFYLVMPMAYSEGGYVDVRALAFVPIFGVLGIIAGSGPPASPAMSRRRHYSLGCVVLLVVLNLLYLGEHLQTDTARARGYRIAAARVPLHSRVLPVYTLEKEGIARPFLHVGAFVAMDRQAFTPYLFSADVGSPMKYFRYLSRPYAPSELWYIALQHQVAGLPFEAESSPDVDWGKVAAAYQYLLVTKPFDIAVLPVAKHVVFENGTATLFQLD